MTIGVVGRIRDVLGRARPVLIFLAGPNGAGKSTFFEIYLNELRLPFVNADVIAQGLKETPLSPAEEDLDRVAFTRTEELRHSLLAERLSFCTETVFSDPHRAKLQFLEEARARGYVVFLVFIGLSDPNLSIARVMQRVETGGHDVPDEKLHERFPRTLENLAAAVPLVDEAFIFDNSSDRDPFRLVAIYARGELVERAEPIPDWATGLLGLGS